MNGMKTINGKMVKLSINVSLNKKSINKIKQKQRF